MNTLNKKSLWSVAIPYIVLVVFCLIAPVFFKSRTWLNSFITIFVSIVGATSLRTIALSGNMSFAQGAFIGVGAYVAGVLGKELGISMFLTIPLGAVAATILGLITGWPFARLRSIYFCMGSMFMGVAIIQFISSMVITGGANGLRGVPSMSKTLTGIFDGPLWESLGLGGPQLCYYFFLFVTLLCCVLLYRFEHSRIGWTLKALSQSPPVAASIGVNEKFYRLLSVGLGSFCAGLIGATYAHYSTTLSPNSYSMGTTLWLIMYMMIGGQNNFLGPVVGAIVLELIKQTTTLLTAMSGKEGATEGFVSFARWASGYSAYIPFLTALVLLIMAYFIPGGLVGIPDAIRRSREKKRESRLEAAAAAQEGGEG